MENKYIIERINKVMQVEATVPQKGDFLLTHVPFENLFHGESTPITEEELFREHLVINPQKHKLIMIQGENGSGKSHLIRWLYEKYLDSINTDIEKVLLISRAHNTLQDTLMQLLNSDIFPEEVKKNELEKIRNAQTAITGDELKKTVNFNFTLIIEDDIKNKEMNTELELPYLLMLPDYLKNPYILNTFFMREGGALDRICLKLNNMDNSASRNFEGEVFTEKDFDIGLDQIKTYLEATENRASQYTITLARKFYQNGNNIRKKAAAYLNSKVNDVIQKSLKLHTSDFEKLFKSLREKLKDQGMNLSLFIEDINAFTGIDLALMEVLITNHEATGNEAYCRLCSVVGSTNDFYNNRLNDNIKERVRNDGAEIFIREESLFGTSERLVKFAAKYINACYLSETELQEWEANDYDEFSMPIAKGKYRFSTVNCFGKDMSIFPFNETAICNLYDCLNSRSKTPRRFLLDVIYPVLQHYYMNPESFLDKESKFKNDSISSINDFISKDYNIIHKQVGDPDSDKRSLLLRIWGNGTTLATDSTLGGLSREVFEAFNIEMLLDKYPKNITDVTIDMETEPAVSISMPIITAVKNSDSHAMNTNNNGLKIEKNISEWIKNSKQSLAYHTELRGLISKFIIGNMDWDVEEISQKIIETYFGTSKYIGIEGQGTAINENGIVLERTEETEFFLYALVKYRYEGKNSWNFENGFDYYRIAATWLLKHRDAIINVVTVPYESEHSYSDMLIASLYSVRALNGGINVSANANDVMLKMFETKFASGIAHGTVWTSVREELNEIELPEKHLDNIVAFYSNAVGTAEGGETKYIFVDAYRILQSIQKLYNSNWELKGYVINGLDIQKKEVWYKAPRIVSTLYKNVEKIIAEEVSFAKSYATYFAKKIDKCTDSKQIEDTFEKMMDYQRYLRNKQNLSYEESDFVEIKNLKNARLLADELKNIFEILNVAEGVKCLSMLSKNPFEKTSVIYQEFLKFDALLEEKNKKYKSGINESVDNEIEHHRKNILNSLERLIYIGQGVL